MDATDCLLVGAGPAGVATALWLETHDVEYTWVAREGRVGGILDHVYNPIGGLPGATWSDGSQLRRDLRRQVEDSQLTPPRPGAVASIRRTDAEWRIEGDGPALASGLAIAAHSVILATGTRRRTLGVPGEQEGLGAHVSLSTTRDAARFTGRTVAMVGGGDAGFEGALQLAEADCRVHMLLRNDDVRARQPFVDRVRAERSIQIHPTPTVVRRIDELSDPRGCRLHLEVRGAAEVIEVAGLFVRIGVEPVLPALSPEPETDDDGHLVVDRAQETSLDGLLAVGDVTDTPVPSVAVAAGGGARAAHRVAQRAGLV